MAPASSRAATPPSVPAPSWGAFTNFDDPERIAALSEDLGEAMVGINEDEIKTLMAERGK